MKVLLVHSRYRSGAPSGENRVVDQESALLAASGHEVERFQRDSDDIANWPLARKMALPARSIFDSQVRSELSRRLEQARPDVVHIHNTFPLISPSVLYACRDQDVPVVATLHNYKLLCASGDFFRQEKPCHECAGGKVAPAIIHGCYRGSRLASVPVTAGMAVHRPAWRGLVSAFIFISSSQRELMRQLGLPEERLFVKHNFVMTAPNGPQRRREHTVIYLGRLDPAKGAPLLMRAWDVFRQENPQSSLRLTVAGGGPLGGDVRRWAEARDSVDFRGLLRPDEAASLLRHTLAAIVPSQWEETFGLVAVEAMAAGVAPVAPARGSFPELITDGVNGALFTPGDARDLARILRDVDRDPHRYVGYGGAGRATYEERFAPAANLRDLLDVYRFAMERPIVARGATS